MAKKAKNGKGDRTEDKEAQASERTHSVAVAAYFLAEKRGFQPGCELDDWVLAEHALAPVAEHEELT